MTIKEQLKGTCVLNEKEGMGAEIVALYTKAGFKNHLKLRGSGSTGVFYGEENGDVSCWENKSIFQSVLTLSKLREIVSTPEHEYKEPIKWEFAKSEPQFKAGDVVEVEGLEYTPEFVHSFDNIAWVKTSGQNFGQLVPLNKLRHPKDKIKEKIKEVMEKWDLLIEGKCNANVYCAMQDMAKWSQENPK